VKQADPVVVLSFADVSQRQYKRVLVQGYIVVSHLKLSVSDAIDNFLLVQVHLYYSGHLYSG